MPKHSTDFTTKLVNGLLGIDPLARLLKHQARSMMIKRAETIGVFWHQEANALRWRDAASDSHSADVGQEVAAGWLETFKTVTRPELDYPSYYLQPFHAYAEGNLGWLPALEVEVAAKAVHARIWPEAGAEGDAWLRRSYHEALRQQLPTAPQQIVDLGCSVGMSTFTLQECYPQAELTGVDLSPYFLAVAHYRDQQRLAQGSGDSAVHWVHAPAEATELPAASFDLVSACLVFHELPQSAAYGILQEARRLLRSGGHVAIMDMNPQSETFAKMPPYVLTLLKSTEPYLDEYFGLEIPEILQSLGFDRPQVTLNSPRHRTIVAQAL
ncbi:MAG: class I SAM-dependent methyltransferase [Prochlorotrichaceae cyanobacterium]|jgi:ubiquinone/menaquinone biosynthesis C-methylase UbiE